MGIKLQFNPSTGKLSYNASTGKVQIVDDGIGPVVPCSECDTPTPSTIYVTLSGLSLCCAEYTLGGSVNDIKYDDGILPLLNTTHVLTKSSECLLYQSSFSAVADNLYLRSFTPGGGCIGTPAGERVLSIAVDLFIAGDELTVAIASDDGGIGPHNIQQIHGVNQYPCFNQTLTDPEYTACSDLILPGGVLEGFTAVTIGGTAVISETP